jgi:hypothetical protein
MAPRIIDQNNQQYYEYGGGSVFQVAATANGVAYSGTVASPKSTSSSSSSGSKSTTPSNTGSGNSARGVNSGFYTATILVISGVTLGASLVFI